MNTGLFTLLFLFASATQSARLPVEIVSFKIVSYYNPLLERSAPMDAGGRELERTPAEKVAAAQRSTPRSPQERANEIGIAPGAAPRLKHVSPAEWVYFTVKNVSRQPIKTIVWEFAFLRMEQGQLVLQQSVTNEVELKPDKQKTFRQPLPAGASRCKVVSVQQENGKAIVPEYVCGRGFADPSLLPSLLKEKLEPASITRIEFADGSSWERR